MTSDPKILFIDHTGELAGGQLCLADVAVALRDRCQVFLFEPGPFSDLLKKKGVRVQVPQGESPALTVRKKSKLFAYLASVPVLVSLVRSLARVAKDFDLLYANTAKALLVSIPVARVLRKPLLFHLHDIIGVEHFNRLNSWLMVTGANWATGIVANSKASAAAYRQAGGENRNLTVIPNGFPIELFQTGDEGPSRRLRQSLGGEVRPLLGLFGRIAAWKGQKVLIEALSKLPQVNGVIVGEAIFTREDQEYKSELISLAGKLGVADRLKFTGFQTDILPYLKAVDLVVHCSTSPEPFGRVIVEAQLAGKPVIATKGGGPSEIIEDRLTGLLVTPNDSKELAIAIEELLANPSWAEQLAENGREAAARRFGLNSVLKQWIDFIDRNVPRRQPDRLTQEADPALQGGSAGSNVPSRTEVIPRPSTNDRCAGGEAKI